MANSLKGFTLLEVLLSLAILALLAGLSAPVYLNLQSRNDLAVATTTLAQTLRRAQTLAMAVASDSTWGVKVQTGNFTLFKGLGYSARDPSFDEIFDLPSNLISSGPSEIIFSKFTGEPQTTGNITLTNVNNENRTLSVSPKGMISY